MLIIVFFMGSHVHRLHELVRTVDRAIYDIYTTVEYVEELYPDDPDEFEGRVFKRVAEIVGQAQFEVWPWLPV